MHLTRREASGSAEVGFGGKAQLSQFRVPRMQPLTHVLVPSGSEAVWWSGALHLMGIYEAPETVVSNSVSNLKLWKLYFRL